MPRQHQCPARQRRHRLHHQQGRPARSGGARDDHRAGWRIGGPDRAQPFGHHPPPRFGLRAGIGAEERGDQRQKPLRPRPVRRMVRHIQRRNRLWGDAFARHLVHQVGQTVGQIVKRGCRGQVRFGLQQPGNQLCQLQPAAQGGFGRRQAGDGVVLGEVRHQPYAGQQCGGGELRPDPVAHAGGVDPKGHPRHRLGRGIAHPGAQAAHEGGGKVRPGGDAVNRAVSHGRPRPASIPRSRCLRGGPHRTIALDAPRQRPGPARSARPSGG